MESMPILDSSFSNIQKLNIRSFQIELEKSTDLEEVKKIALQLYVAKIQQQNCYNAMLAKEWGIALPISGDSQC